tara:strand:+ start:405 stop:743 length:339 start_codon:yes stop_codon:yes gene_type:complete
MGFIKNMIKNRFKISPPYVIDNIPVYHVTEEDGTLGRALLNGSVTVNEDVVDVGQEEEIVSHEKVHVEQIKRGDLSYTDTNIIWKGKKYSRDYNKKSPWEKEAYAKEKKRKN